jgi:hypothetical protein
LDKFLTDSYDQFSLWQFPGDTTVKGVFDFSNITQKTAASAVPLPGAVWLLGTGMVALAGLRRKYAH